MGMTMIFWELQIGKNVHCSFVLQSYHEEELLALQDQRYYFLFQGFVIEKGIMYEESLI